MIDRLTQHEAMRRDLATPSVAESYRQARLAQMDARPLSADERKLRDALAIPYALPPRRPRNER